MSLENNMTLKVKLVNGGKPPTKGSEFAAGYDLYCNEKGRIGIGRRQLISTGICVAIPPGHYGRIAPRSGLAVKMGIDVSAGVVDEDYRGEIKILLVNNGMETFVFLKGDRIAQLIIEKISTPPVEVVEELPDSKRGEGGFGSTGTN
jgi:dUTP pyrophosphatase